MARICTACGRALDAKGHRIARVGEPKRERGRPQKTLLAIKRGRGRFGFQRAKVYECRVVPAYDSPKTGKVTALAPYPQRAAAVNFRHVQESRIGDPA